METTFGIQIPTVHHLPFFKTFIVEFALNRFRLESNKEGTRWFGKCWHIVDLKKYEFDVEFDIPVTYPMTAPEIALPGLSNSHSCYLSQNKKTCPTP